MEVRHGDDYSVIQFNGAGEIALFVRCLEAIQTSPVIFLEDEAALWDAISEEF